MTDGAEHLGELKKLDKLIRGIGVAMLTTDDEDGSLRSRPMMTLDHGFDGTLWFFTDADTAKVHDVEHDRHVNVSFAKPEKHQYVSLSGTARVVHDPELMRKLWKPALKAWFPEGLNDPELSLLRVECETAEFWDAPQSRMVQLWSLAKSLLLRRGWENGRLELSH